MMMMIKTTTTTAMQIHTYLDTQRETDRQTDRQTDRDRNRGGNTEKERGIYKSRLTERHSHTLTDKYRQ